MRDLWRFLRTGEHVCPWWFAYTFDNRLRRLVHPAPEVLGRYVEPGMTAVDVGCGMGHFTLGLARLVGERGRVVAVDLQQKMLDVTAHRARQEGLGDRVELHRCAVDALGISVDADFVLTFWMAHEVPDRGRFMREIHGLLEAGGIHFLAEPKLHVSAKKFNQICDDAAGAGLHLAERPAVALSRAAVFQKAKETVSMGAEPCSRER